MSRVVIPALMRDLTGGRAAVEVEGGAVGELVDALDRLYPGCAARLCPEGRLAPELTVVVDGRPAPLLLRARVGPDSEVRFIPTVAGG